MADVLLTPYACGPDAYRALASLLKGRFSRPLLIGGEKAMRAAGGELEAALEQAGLSLIAALQYGGQAGYAAAEGHAKQALALGADIVLAMGGGRALDTAKTAAHIAGLPVVTLPTIAATCAAVTKLCVLYKADGGLDRFLYMQRPPLQCFVNTAVIARAPARYLRAGIGDSLSKHVEAPFAARGADLSHSDSMGISLAEGLWPALQSCAAQAMAEANLGEAGDALTKAVLCCIASVGYVSLLVAERFNGALAHSLFYALEPLPQMHGVLHGDAVAWGALVQLRLDGQQAKAEQMAALFRSIGLPCAMRQMGLDLRSPQVLAALPQALDKPDMRELPYPIGMDAMLAAISRQEEAAGC